MKNFRHFTELFQRTKRWAEKIPVQCTAYDGKNKSGQLAENKPAYGRIKNSCFKFGK